MRQKQHRIATDDMVAEAKMQINRHDHDRRKVLLDRIRGTTVTIPNLRPIFEKYTGSVNPNYEAMIPVVNSRLERLVFSSLVWSRNFLDWKACFDRCDVMR